MAWPKVLRSKQGMREHLDTGQESPRNLFSLLAEREAAPQAADAGLPWPATSGPFIAHERYGTRCSTVVTRQSGTTWIGERRFGPRGAPRGGSELRLQHDG